MYIYVPDLEHGVSPAPFNCNSYRSDSEDDREVDVSLLRIASPKYIAAPSPS